MALPFWQGQKLTLLFLSANCRLLPLEAGDALPSPKAHAACLGLSLAGSRGVWAHRSAQGCMEADPSRRDVREMARYTSGFQSLGAGLCWWGGRSGPAPAFGLSGATVGRWAALAGPAFAREPHRALPVGADGYLPELPAPARACSVLILTRSGTWVYLSY